MSRGGFENAYMTLLPSGSLRVRDQAGIHEIGGDHPDFARLKAEYQRSECAAHREPVFSPC